MTKEDIKVKPLVGGRSTISPNDNSLAGRLLSALNGNSTKIGNYLITTNTFNKKKDEFEKEGIVCREETAAENEDGQLLILPSETKEAGALSCPESGSSSDGKVNNNSEQYS